MGERKQLDYFTHKNMQESSHNSRGNYWNLVIPHTGFCGKGQKKKLKESIEKSTPFLEELEDREEGGLKYH